MQLRRTSPTAADDALAAVRRLNAWAGAQRGRPREQVAAELDVAAARLSRTGPTPVVRVGRRLHLATRLRFH